MSSLEDLVDEASRQFGVCAACRYCEDYCAVFPAIERRRLFTEGDLGYIANLCHDCRACYQACMYTAPHEFDLNLPALLTESRTASYERYARPRAVARMLDGGPVAITAATVAMAAVIVAIMVAVDSIGSLLHASSGPGSFYALVPHAAMVAVALTVTGLVLIAVGCGVAAFWRDGGEPLRALLSPRTWGAALRDALTLRWLGGGGDNCYYPDRDHPSDWRRRFHHLVAYGFLATFAATVAAFAYEQALDREPPFPWLTLPVQLGFWGGIGVVVGTAGLGVLKWRSDRTVAQPTGSAFLVSLFLAGVTGTLLLVLRSTGAMGVLLVVHLATVFALLLTAPYTRFVHVAYRLASVYRSTGESLRERAS